MKNIVLLSAVLVIALITSCATPKDETVPENTDEIIEEFDDDNPKEKIEEEIEQEDENAPENNDSVTEDEEGVTEDIKIDTGKFNGLADVNFFEVKISGVPDSIPPKMFMLTDDVREKFENLNLQQDDEVKVHYYETSDGQLIVTDIEKISQ
ncbi:hypothetical protein [Sedimentibacter sp. MB31-C6]|uniref:hypothetical protein n=1 Tax=Sedimentibacter sp. MB31-C6 TaxID=3109366 RepID=UPI002DDD7E04|nr:hypothetical protein [Sedimentibacter sp. MB36-C1]WSI03188.1 hypothetical protein U8307_09045 [Sedimentibacter sp. MB36-C1]